MMSKCSICRLPAQALAVVDAALRENMPLQVISDRTGLTKSSIWRRGRHLVKAEGAATPPKALPKAKTVEPALPAVRTQTPGLPVSEPPVDVEASRKRALDRAEELWSEVSECLQLAREPVKIVKPDGTELEVPVDLRTRSSVIRAGKDVIDLDARLNGLYDAGPQKRHNRTGRSVSEGDRSTEKGAAAGHRGTGRSAARTAGVR